MGRQMKFLALAAGVLNALSGLQPSLLGSLGALGDPKSGRWQWQWPRLINFWMVLLEVFVESWC